MSHVFISYRRDDSAATCGRIYDRLVSHFGREAIFIDVDNIPLGVNFEQYIAGAMEQCSVLLAVIGTRWLDVADVNGQPRLLDPNDVVRLEIEAALRRQIPVIPILVQGAQIPQADRLPSSLQALRMQNGLPVRDDRDFDNDMRHLAGSLERWIPRRANGAPQTEPASGQQSPAMGAPAPTPTPTAQPYLPPQPAYGQHMNAPTNPSFGQPYAAPVTGPGAMGAPAGQYARPAHPSVPVSAPVTPMGNPAWGQATPPAPPMQPMPAPMPPQPMQPPMSPPMSPPIGQPYMPGPGGNGTPPRKTNVGLIAGIVGGLLVLVCVGSLILAAAVSNNNGGNGGTPTQTTGAPASVWNVELQQVNSATSYNGFTTNPGYYFVLPQMVIENQSSTAQIFRSDFFSLKDSTGQIYSESQASNPGQSVNVDPGHTATLTFSYVVPTSQCTFKYYFIPNQGSQKTWDISFTGC